MINNTLFRRVMGMAAAGTLGTTAWAAESITTFWGNSYSQDFDTLSTAGSNQTTVPSNWVISEDGGTTVGNYTFNTGTSVQDLHSYATSSGATDRALGVQFDTGGPNRMFGITFKNNTGSTITQISLSYLAEIWRKSGTDTDRLDFEYSQTTTTGSGVFSVGGGSVMTSWLAANSHDFVISGSESTGTSTTIAGLITLNSGSISVANGGFFAIRWRDSNGGGSSGWGLAVDDLFISVPEPWQPAAVAGFGLLGLACWKRGVQRGTRPAKVAIL